MLRMTIYPHFCRDISNAAYASEITSLKEAFMTDLDISVLLWIQNHLRRDWLNPIMVFITHFFGKAGIFWIALTLLLILYKKTRPVGLTSMLSIVINVLAVNVIVKPIVARPRPYDVTTALTPLVEHLSDYSFPSGHTACAFACAVVLFRLLPKKFGIPALVLAFLVAISRLYVGVHYPTDVICGALFGTAAALIACRLMPVIRRKMQERRKA